MIFYSFKFLRFKNEQTSVVIFEKFQNFYMKYLQKRSTHNKCFSPKIETRMGSHRRTHPSTWKNFPNKPHTHLMDLPVLNDMCGDACWLQELLLGSLFRVMGETPFLAVNFFFFLQRKRGEVSVRFNRFIFSLSQRANCVVSLNDRFQMIFFSKITTAALIIFNSCLNHVLLIKYFIKINC